jgi:hypothetical protein
MANTKTAPVKNDEIKEDEKMITETENIEVETDEVDDSAAKLNELLSGNQILSEFTKKYLVIYKEIAEYNKSVLAAKDSEWNVGKVMTKAQEFAKPEPNSGIKPVDEIADLVKAYEDLVIQVAQAKRAVIERTSKELGISLSNTAERDPIKEEELKQKRVVAVQLGTQLSSIATMISDKNISDGVTEFLTKNPLPSVGRASSHTFAGDGAKSTPKYRVKVAIYKDGTLLEEFDGFSKTALNLSNSKFGYARGQAPKADKLRSAWESAGNNADTTVQPTVEFDDNGLHFVLTKK